jgi:hypothetical protein
VSGVSSLHLADIAGPAGKSITNLLRSPLGLNALIRPPVSGNDRPETAPFHYWMRRGAK